MAAMDFEFPAELVEIGLMAVADPQFAERLLAALEPARASDRPATGTGSGPDLGTAAGCATRAIA